MPELDEVEPPLPRLWAEERQHNVGIDSGVGRDVLDVFEESNEQ